MKKINYKKENIALAKTIFKESKTRKEKLQKLASLEITDKDFDQVEKILVKMTTLKQRQEELIKKQGNEIIATITHRKIIKTRKEDWLKAHRGKKEKDIPLAVLHPIEDEQDLIDEDGEYIGDLWEDY